MNPDTSHSSDASFASVTYPVTFSLHESNLFIMNRISSVLTLVVLCTGSFLVGRCVQHWKTGYHFDVRHEKLHETDLGILRERYLTEKVGIPFLDRGVDTLELNHIRIYSNILNRDDPGIRNLLIEGNRFRWDDGWYRYDVTIEDLSDQERFPHLRLPPEMQPEPTPPSPAEALRK